MYHLNNYLKYKINHLHVIINQHHGVATFCNNDGDTVIPRQCVAYFGGHYVYETHDGAKCRLLFLPQVAYRQAAENTSASLFPP